MTRATTHLIEYRPYRLRNECCAVGLLVIWPDGEVKIHVAGSLRKVRAMHPATDIDNLRDELHKLASDMSNNPDLLKLHLTSPVGALRLAQIGRAHV